MISSSVPTARLRVRRSLLCAVLLTILGGLAWTTPSAVAGTHRGSTQPLKVVGQLPEPAPRSERTNAGQIVAFDQPHHRMFYIYPDANSHDDVVTYDLRPKIPQPIAHGVLAPTLEVLEPSPYVTAYDSKRGHLLFVGVNAHAAGQTATTFQASVIPYDTKRNHALPTWDLAATVPGYYVFGMTYSAVDDSVYLLGEFSDNAVSANWGFGSKAAGPGTAVVALDPATGKVRWVKPVPECQQALYTLNIGSLIARSHSRPALYFTCVTGASFLRQTFPGEAGVVRINMGRRPTSASSVTHFTTDFFPISGQYFNGAGEGIASFDYHDDRLFLQSLAAQTPGAWVFDGKLSSWVGFISAPDHTDSFTGFNESLGHLYMGLNTQGTPSKTDGIVVADARETPVPSGSFQHLTPIGFIPADAGSRRLFVLPNSAHTDLHPYLVVKDVSPNVKPPDALDYDSLTDGVSEAHAAFVSYSSDVNAYGADVVLVGGTGGPVSASGDLVDLVQPPVAGGSRGVVMARIGGIGLRPAGASASAQAVTVDLNSTKDYETNGLGNWPYGTASCLDSGGGIKPQSSDRDGATAKAQCSLAKGDASGASTAQAANVGPVVVAHSSAEGASQRDAASGATSNVSAAASGIRIDLAGLWRLDIASVSAHVGTRSHGADGTAGATYERTIRGIEVRDAKGKVVFGPETCSTSVAASGGHPAVVHDTCQQIAKQLDPIVQTRMHLAFPLPESIATPHGAYAAIQQTDADYYQERTVNDQGVVFPHDSTAQRPIPALQLVVYNDTTERSRVLAQFAAVQGDSIFDTTAGTTTSNVPPPDSVPTAHQPGAQPPPTDTTKPGHLPGGGTQPGTSPVTAPPAVAAPATGLTGWLFLHRSLRDALLLAGILAIAAGAGLLAARRHQLLLAMSAPTERPRS